MSVWEKCSELQQWEAAARQTDNLSVTEEC